MHARAHAHAWAHRRAVPRICGAVRRAPAATAPARAGPHNRVSRAPAAPFACSRRRCSACVEAAPASAARWGTHATPPHCRCPSSRQASRELHAYGYRKA